MSRALKTAALFALLAAVCVAAPVRGTRAVGSTHTIESHTFDDCSETKKYELPVAGSVSRTRLRVKGSVHSGEMKLTVRDPSGKVRQDLLLKPDRAKPNTFDADTGEERAMAGKWTLVVELKNASGNFEFTWTAE